MAPTIRIDDDVYDRLKEQAEPFVDTPNTVLRRVLGLEKAVGADVAAPEAEPEAVGEAKAKAAVEVRKRAAPRAAKRTAPRGGKKPKRTRVPNGSLLPETEYDRPLLEALVELGGSAPARSVVEAVGERVKDRLTELDRERLPSGGIRWENRLQFVRLRLVEEGFMVKESGRGIWAISDEGRRFVATTASGVA